MGRKNRNARGRSYSSFSELKSESTRFDLSNVQCYTKIKNRHGYRGEYEVAVSLGDNGRGNDIKYVTFSVKDEEATKMKKEYGYNWTCGIVKQDFLERLYLLPDEKGFAMYKSKTGTRHYARVRIDDYSAYKKYYGGHKLQFDEYNKAYYITASE